MSEAPSFFQRHSGVTSAVALLAIPVSFVFWWLLREQPAPEIAGPGLQPSETAVATIATALPAANTPSVPPKVEKVAMGDGLPDGLRIAPANSGEPHEPGMLPHPITPQHARIFRENALIGQLNGAMDVKDARGLRALLTQYRDEYPEDANVLQDGYELIANCIERPGPETRAVAQRYYDEQLDSGLRRYLRRHCLEN